MNTAMKFWTYLFLVTSRQLLAKSVFRADSHCLSTGSACTRLDRCCEDMSNCNVPFGETFGVCISSMMSAEGRVACLKEGQPCNSDQNFSCCDKFYCDAKTKLCVSTAKLGEVLVSISGCDGLADGETAVSSLFINHQESRELSEIYELSFISTLIGQAKTTFDATTWGSAIENVLNGENITSSKVTVTAVLNSAAEPIDSSKDPDTVSPLASPTVSPTVSSTGSYSTPTPSTSFEGTESSNPSGPNNNGGMEIDNVSSSTSSSVVAVAGVRQLQTIENTEVAFFIEVNSDDIESVKEFIPEHGADIISSYNDLAVSNGVEQLMATSIETTFIGEILTTAESYSDSSDTIVLRVVVAVVVAAFVITLLSILFIWWRRKKARNFAVRKTASNKDSPTTKTEISPQERSFRIVEADMLEMGCHLPFVGSVIMMCTKISPIFLPYQYVEENCLEVVRWSRALQDVSKALDAMILVNPKLERLLNMESALRCEQKLGELLGLAEGQLSARDILTFALSHVISDLMEKVYESFFSVVSRLDSSLRISSLVPEMKTGRDVEILISALEGTQIQLDMLKKSSMFNHSLRGTQLISLPSASYNFRPHIEVADDGEEGINPSMELSVIREESEDDIPSCKNSVEEWHKESSFRHSESNDEFQTPFREFEEEEKSEVDGEKEGTDSQASSWKQFNFKRGYFSSTKLSAPSKTNGHEDSDGNKEQNDGEIEGGRPLQQLDLSPSNYLRIEDEPIGVGRLSKVYKVEFNGKVRASKVMELTGLSFEKLQQIYMFFAEEVPKLNTTHHARVVMLYGFSSTLSEITIIQEYVPKGCLRKLLNSEEAWNQTKPKQRHRILLDIIEGMIFLQQHGNLRSTNVLITNDLRAKLSDFGLSKTAHSFKMAIQSDSESSDPVTVPQRKPSDVYSFGLIIMEVLVGILGQQKALGYIDQSDRDIETVFIDERQLRLPQECITEQNILNATSYEKMMSQCLDPSLTNRPTFKKMKNRLGQE